MEIASKIVLVLSLFHTTIVPSAPDLRNSRAAFVLIGTVAVGIAIAGVMKV